MRKNAIVILSNIGLYVQFDNVELSNAALDTLTDVISDPSGNYRYTALEALAKLTLIDANWDMITHLANQTSTRLYRVVRSVLGTLPTAGLTCDATPEELAAWEMASLVIYNLASVEDRIRYALVRTPGFVTLMVKLCRRPTADVVRVQSTTTPASKNTQQQQSAQFAPICRRSMRTLVECARVSGNREVLVRYEKDLMGVLTDASGEGVVNGLVDQEVEGLAAECLYAIHTEE
ncbi:hypothetical protein HK104_004330 [Borealophlyctis nickersoniae]|nr:hypothetical protein HK104_004330 [Borealophlyctis nickersoniae]